MWTYLEKGFTFFPVAVSVSDLNDEDGAAGSSKSNSVNSIQSTGISASSQVKTWMMPSKCLICKLIDFYFKASSTNSLPVGGVGVNQGEAHVDNHHHHQHLAPQVIKNLPLSLIEKTFVLNVQISPTFCPIVWSLPKLLQLPLPTHHQAPTLGFHRVSAGSHQKSLSAHGGSEGPPPLPPPHKMNSKLTQVIALISKLSI